MAQGWLSVAGSWIVGWLIARWLVIGVALCFAQETLLRWLERRDLLGPVVAFVSWVEGTVASRVLIGAVTLTFLVLVCWAGARSRSALVRALALPAITTALVLATRRFFFVPPPLWVVLLGAGLLGINGVPDSVWLAQLATPVRGRVADWMVAGFPWGVEAVAWKPVVLWAGRRIRGSRFRGLGALSHVVTAAPVCVLWVLSLDGRWLAPVDRWLRHDPAVRRFADGDVGDLALDVTRRRLYAVGHGSDRIRAFDIDHLGARVRYSHVPTGEPEFLGYSPERGELYVHQARLARLLVIDADTLKLKTSFPLPRIAEGDAWVRYDRALDVVVLASEADAFDGPPFVVLDRATGLVTDREDLDAGAGVLLDPGRPWAYLSFFRRRAEVLLYDLAAHAIRARAPSHPRSAQIAYWRQGNEILVASPVRGAAQRFDAESLEPRGVIPTQPGGRSLEVDAQRNLLLSASLTTGDLVVIDLATGARVAAFYLGPWLRMIHLDEQAGVAYVSSVDGAYRVDYLPRSRFHS